MHKPDMIAFDLETASTNQQAVILSLGVVPFNVNNDLSFNELVAAGTNVVFETDPQREMGLQTDPKTLEWWSKQSKFARTSLTNPNIDRVHPINGIKALVAGIGIEYKDFCHMKWWARGSHFDAGVLLNFTQTFGMPEFCFYNRWRDIRAFMDAFPDYVCPERPESFIAHNSLHDAALEAWEMQDLFKNIKAGNV